MELMQMRFLKTIINNLRQKPSQTPIRSFSNHSGMFTHTPGIEKPSRNDIADKVLLIKRRLNQMDHDKKSIQSLVNLTDELTEFELGRFMIQNNGALSGYWTQYVIMGQRLKTYANELEKFILTKAPTVLATQERFSTFQTILRNTIKSNMITCSIPCGTMTDLLTLELDDRISNVTFVGMDLDASVLAIAEGLSKNLPASYRCEFFQRDARNIREQNKFDVLTSNGLNIYESCDDNVVQLYKQFFSALKPGGKLIASALSMPPGKEQPSDWDMTQINREDLEKQLAIFSFILQASWANFRTKDQTLMQLQEAGFEHIEFIWDKQKIFPSITARRP